MKPPLIRAPISTIALLLACLALAGLLTGCGGGDDADDLADDHVPTPRVPCVSEQPLLPCRAHSI